MIEEIYLLNEYNQSKNDGEILFSPTELPIINAVLPLVNMFCELHQQLG